MAHTTQPRQNGKGSVRSRRRASIEKSLFPRAMAARVRAKSSLTKLFGAAGLSAAAMLLFAGGPAPLAAGVAGVGICLWIAADWLAARIDRFEPQFRKRFGCPVRVIELEEDSRRSTRVRSYLRKCFESDSRRATRFNESQKWVLALGVVGVILSASAYHESHKVVAEGIYPLPESLAYLDPVLNDSETRPTVLANLPGKVVQVSHNASDIVTKFVNAAPIHLDHMQGAAMTGDKSGLNQAADALDRDLQTADDALRDLENSPLSPDARKFAADARKKLGNFKNTVQNARQNPSQIQQARSELSKVIEFLLSLLNALAKFLSQLLSFLQGINSGGMSGHGVSASTATQGAAMAAKAMKGQAATQGDFNQLRASYTRDFKTMPPTFIPPPGMQLPTGLSPNDPIVDLTVPPALTPSSPPKRSVDRGADRTTEKPEQKNPNQTGPVAPNT
jgi:hypothetical protein